MQCEQRFFEIYGRDPEGLSFSPYRVCPIGAHSDHNLGKITGFAIDKGIHIAYRPKKNGVVEMTSLQFPKRAQWHIASVPKTKENDWADYLRGATWALSKTRPLTTGICGVIEGSLPIGGLSSSAAVILAFLSYLRIRNQADGLDSSRTARQRRMMVAIFKKLKNEGKLSQIPALINAASSGIYTNTTLSQTTALANYAAKLDGDRIQTRAMFGDLGEVEYEWRYAYVDQQNRIDIIRDVFGIEAEPVGICTRQFERWLHTVGFSAMKYMRQAEKVLTRVQEMKDAGGSFTEEQIALYGDCYRAYVALRNGFDSARDALSSRYATTPWREKKNNKRNWTEENKAADQELSALEADILQNLNDLKASSKDATIRLSDAIGFKTRLTWTVPIDWFKDPDINEAIKQP